MNSKDVHLGEPTLKQMNAEINANTAALAELQNPEVPDMAMSRDKLVELAGDINTEGMTKADIIEAITLAKDPE